MKYKCDTIITENYLYNLLQKRGVDDINNFLSPIESNLINPFLLDNIVEAANLLLKHIQNLKDMVSNHMMIFMLQK